jgi:hypothetical protein
VSDILRTRTRAAVVSVVVQAGGAFLAAMLILVSVSGSTSTDSGRLLVSLVIAWCGVAFLATFFARRRAERSTRGPVRRTDDPLLPLAAMAGPILFCLWTVIARAGDVGVWPLVAQIVFPLAAAAAGYVIARPGDDAEAPVWQRSRDS